MDSHLEVGHFGDVDPYLGIRGVGDVPGLAVHAAVLDRNHEIVGQQRRKNFDTALLVGLGPLELKGTNGGSVRLFLTGQYWREAAEQARNSNPSGNAHTTMSPQFDLLGKLPPSLFETPTTRLCTLKSEHLPIPRNPDSTRLETGAFDAPLNGELDRGLLDHKLWRPPAGVCLSPATRLPDPIIHLPSGRQYGRELRRGTGSPVHSQGRSR